MLRMVRDKGDALAYVGTYFFEEESCLFSQWLPRYYFFCVKTLLRVPAYALLFVFPFLIFPSAKAPLTIWLAYGGVFVLKSFVIRSICSNLLVVTQQSVYLYFRYHAERVAEVRWSDVQTVTFRTWRFAPSLATVTLRKRGHAIQIRPLLDKLRTYHNRYKEPEALDYRELSLRKPHTVRLVVRNHEELYERCKQLKQTEGHTYLLRRKGKQHAQRETNRNGTGK